jgi:hypothetical protein
VFVSSLSLFRARVNVGERWESILSYLFCYALFPFLLFRDAPIFGVLNSMVLKPFSCCPSACVRLGDLCGITQINLVLKTVSYYPQTEEWREPPGWWTLSEGTSHVFRSTLQGYEAIDCRPLTVIWDYLYYPTGHDIPLWWNFVKIITLINCLYNFGCNSHSSSNNYFN